MKFNITKLSDYLRLVAKIPLEFHIAHFHFIDLRFITDTYKPFLSFSYFEICSKVLYLLHK